MLAEDRRVLHGTQLYTRVVANDEPGHGNACHKYSIQDTREVKPESPKGVGIYAQIQFQDGPIKENGVNGIHNEDLLVIVMDRLEGFQSGDYACPENDMAIECLKDALHNLNRRTYHRQNRGVEGTSKV